MRRTWKRGKLAAGRFNTKKIPLRNDDISPTIISDSTFFSLFASIVIRRRAHEPLEVRSGLAETLGTFQRLPAYLARAHLCFPRIYALDERFFLILRNFYSNVDALELAPCVLIVFLSKFRLKIYELNTLDVDIKFNIIIGFSIMAAACSMIGAILILLQGTCTWNI